MKIIFNDFSRPFCQLPFEASDGHCPFAFSYRPLEVNIDDILNSSIREKTHSYASTSRSAARAELSGMPTFFKKQSFGSALIMLYFS